MKAILKGIVLTAFIPIFFSCEALPVNYSTGRSWLISGEKPGENRTALALTGVQVDRIGGWDSIEREVYTLAPLYFWKNGCRVVSAGERALYTAQIQIREREFNYGWRSKKSLAVEVLIRNLSEIQEDGENRHLPVAAGRVVFTGESSFYSSETTERLLSRAIKRAVKKLVSYERKKDA